MSAGRPARKPSSTGSGGASSDARSSSYWRFCSSVPSARTLAPSHSSSENASRPSRPASSASSSAVSSDAAHMSSTRTRPPGRTNGGPRNGAFWYAVVTRWRRARTSSLDLMSSSSSKKEARTGTVARVRLSVGRARGDAAMILKGGEGGLACLRGGGAALTDNNEPYCFLAKRRRSERGKAGCAGPVSTLDHAEPGAGAP
mmetsp:Transcript_14441/g.44583  ORF Transcript_14441/g.44583 Transcript_14441/m.44583 type:complete len:201 (+) Transcript_14441:296-898(+)